MSDRYQHSRLLEPDAFRLVVLKPSSEITAPLDIAIITAKLSQYDGDIIDHYIALSYVWGDQKDTRTITIEGRSLTITASLESALRHLRDASRAMKVWADGICINQIDNEEKNMQIRLMGDIYRLARSTIIFLGEVTPECHLVLDALSSTTIDAKESVRGNTRSTDILSIAEQHILQRPWFTRVWVLQELVLSLDPWVQLGTRRVRWNILTRLLAGPVRELGNGFQHLSAMNDARLSFHLPMVEDNTASAYSTRLFSTLISRRGAGVSDPRDMIWGHLGILGTNLLSAELLAELEKFVGKAYEKSTFDLYARVALYLIKFAGGSRVLSIKEDVALEARRPGLASWAPDWTSFHAAIDIGSIQEVEYCHLRHIAVEVPGCSGLPPVLACVGTDITIIDKIIEDIPPSYFEKFLDATLREFTDLADARTEPKEVYKEIHSRLCEWLGRNSVRYLPPVPSNLEFLEASGWGMNDETQIDNKADGLYEFMKRFWEISERIKAKMTPAGLLETPRRIYRDNRNMQPSYPDDTIRRKCSLVRWLVVSMTYPGGLKDLHGKRVAVLRNSTFALVPQAAQAGDLICKLQPLSAPYVVRELQMKSAVEADRLLLPDIDAEIVHQFQYRMEEVDTKPMSPKDAFLGRRIGHFNFIGECMLEMRMESEWEDDRMILALH